MENAHRVEVKNGMRVASDEGSSDIEIIGVYMPSACCVTKVEHKETVSELQRGPDAEYTYFHDVDCEAFPVQSTQESHQQRHVPELTATWTSQRNWGSGTSYEERNVPSGQGARQGMVKLGVMQWMVRRGTLMLNTSGQIRRVGRNIYGAKMGDRRVGTNHYVVKMGDRRVGTNHYVAKMGDRRVGTIHKVAIMGDRRVGTIHKVAVMGDRRVGTNRNVAEMGDRRVGTNNNVTLTGDVVTISQNNEVKTERTACAVADETARQNHDEVTVLQEFKKPKSFSAADLKSKTEHKEHHDDNADSCFLQSLVPDMKKLSDRKKLKFKELIISSISQFLEGDHA